MVLVVYEYFKETEMINSNVVNKSQVNRRTLYEESGHEEFEVTRILRGLVE